MGTTDEDAAKQTEEWLVDDGQGIRESAAKLRIIGWFRALEMSEVR